MTTKKYSQYIQKQTKGVHNIMLELIFNDYVMYRNNKRIGFLFENKLYLISTDNLKKMLPDAIEEKLFGFEKLILIEDTEDIELLKNIILMTYNDLYLATEYVFDLSSLMDSYSKYPSIIVDLYDSHITFLQFCYEKKLLNLNPLDKCNRIIRMAFANNDLTEAGIKIVEKLHYKWIIYTDKNDEKKEERNSNKKKIRRLLQ